MSSTIPLEMPSSKAPASLLIIDDIPQIHNFLAMHLRSENYTIHRATTGLGGLEIVKNNHIDLVLLDIGLPDISGFDVLMQLKADPQYASIPVVILTIRDLTENIVRALELGAHDYVTKPFEPAELRARVKSVIAMKFFREKLEQSRKQFVTMINSLAEVVFQLTPEGDITFINATWEEISGYSVKNSLLVSLYDFVHPDDVEALGEHLHILINKEATSIKFEARFIHDNERLFWGEVQLRSLSDESDRVTGFAGTLIDITQRKHAQEELEVRRERFQLLIETSDSVIFTVNEIGIIQYASPSISHVLGCTSAEDIEGRSFLALVHSDDRFAAKSALASAVTGSEAASAFELRFAAPQDRYSYCEVSFHNLLHTPAVGGVVVTLRNIDQRRTIQHELELHSSALHALHQSLVTMRTREGDSKVIAESLGILAAAVGIEACSILLCSGGEDELLLVPISEWVSDADFHLPHEELVCLPPVYWLDMLDRRVPVVLDWHTPHAPVREFLERWEIYSLLVFPIISGGRTVGVFYACRTSARDWLEVEQTTLDIAAWGLGSLLNGFSGPASYISAFLQGTTARLNLPPL